MLDIICNVAIEECFIGIFIENRRRIGFSKFTESFVPESIQFETYTAANELLHQF
jgi:hypothetical protein